MDRSEQLAIMAFWPFRNTWLARQLLSLSPHQTGEGVGGVKAAVFQGLREG